ncbi:MAG TPA: FeoC-like transcriptional regulator [Anaerolineales bacterium]|nr:FeoC-like transcriptional regulator [Anaerolineales bacterium]
MLKQLMEIISQEGIYNPTELARRLDTSPALVEQMLSHLERTGHLKSINTCQTTHCQGCPVATGCNTKSPRIWSVS